MGSLTSILSIDYIVKLISIIYLFTLTPRTAKAKVKEDTRTKEERTAEVIVAIANSIQSDIQIMWDIPEKNNTRMIPVIDLGIWIEDGDGTEKVLHSFYKKKVASL